jgi:DNA polymerase III epsilon subunit-like protein
LLFDSCCFFFFSRFFFFFFVPRFDPAESFCHGAVCTLALSQALLPSQATHRLGDLAQALGLPPPAHAHRALDDAATCAALLHKLAAMLPRSAFDAAGGVRADALQRIAASPPWTCKAEVLAWDAGR